MNESNPWYIAVGDSSVGPASTELVVRGIEHGKIPPEALVCEVGGSTWSSLATVEAFHAAVIRSYPPPPPDSEEAQYLAQQGFRFPSLGALPQFEEVEALEEVEMEASEPSYPGFLMDVDGSAQDIDVDVDWGDAGDAGDVRDAGAPPSIDWSNPFESYFLVSDDVELPEARAILESLPVVPRETFRHDGALWNLALCLAYGSDEVGAAAAKAFFDTVTEQGNVERLEWMSRTLLGNGFVPSGIPAEAGQRAFQRLRSNCPPSLQGTAS
jgi:TPR repeat protein